MPRFCIGLSGRTEDLRLVLAEFGDHIHEVFVGAPPHISGSGRAGTVRTDEDTIRAQAALAHQAGVEFVVVANAVCYARRQFTPEFQRRFLDFLSFLAEAGVDAITLAEPFLIEKAVGFRHGDRAAPRVYVSSLVEVVDGDHARRFDQMGVDRIILHQNVNRDIPALRRILEAVRCEIELYANSGSLYQCPYRHAHRAFISHLSADEGTCDDTISPANWYKERCIAIRQANPVEIAMAPTIRPEDVSFYENLGIWYFKIAGRNMPLTWLTGVLEAYLAGRFEGNIADLCDTNLGRPMPFVGNRSLDTLLGVLRAGNHLTYREVCSRFAVGISNPTRGHACNGQAQSDSAGGSYIPENRL